MHVKTASLQVTSEDPAKLQAFYRDVVQLPPMPEIGDGAFNVAGTALIIDGHSETKGSAGDPTRWMFNLGVNDAKAERERLEAHGVEFIRKEGREFWGGVISTFIDPDGNYCQLIEYHPE